MNTYHSLNIEEIDLGSPERNLLAAIILEAKKNSNRKSLDGHYSRKFLRGEEGTSLRELCEYLDWNPEEVIKRLKKNSSSGYTGVIWDRQNQRWRAYIKVDRKVKWIGSYREKDKAIEARKKAELTKK